MEMNTQISHPIKTSCKVQQKRKRTKNQKKKERANKKYWKNVNKSNQTVKESNICTKYSGYMHFLGTNILIDSPTNGIIDIHGMGRIGRKDEKNLRKVLCIVYFHLNVHLY